MTGPLIGFGVGLEACDACEDACGGEGHVGGAHVLASVELRAVRLRTDQAELIEDSGGGFGGKGQPRDGEQAGATADRGLDRVEPGGDFGAEHPDAEEFDGGFEVGGDIGERAIRIGEAVDDPGDERGLGPEFEKIPVGRVVIYGHGAVLSRESRSSCVQPKR